MPPLERPRSLGPAALTGLRVVPLLLAAGTLGCGGGDASQPDPAGGEAQAPTAGAEAGDAPGADAPPAGPFRVGGDGVDFISSKLRELHRELPADPEPATPVLRTQLGTSEDVSFPVPLEGSRCYRVLGVGVPSVRNLELSLVDDFGHTQARDDVDDAFPALRACPPVDARWTVVLRVFEGYGPVGAQVFVEGGDGP